MLTLKFIEAILDATRNIFFIQTKIDLFDKEAWKATQHRSQEILAEEIRGTARRPARMASLQHEPAQGCAPSGEGKTTRMPT